MKLSDLSDLITHFAEKDDEKVASDIAKLNDKIRNEQTLIKRVLREIEGCSDRSFRAGMEYALKILTGSNDGKQCKLDERRKEKKHERANGV
jgi:hypothetical protein